MAPNWKLELYKRDNWCCQKCGSGVDLGIHHIFPQSRYPELKRNRANLITLCNTCHQHYHNVYCKRNIEKCNPLTFLDWLGEEFVENDYSHEPKYIVRIDKRYKEHFNRIFKEGTDNEQPQNTINQSGAIKRKSPFYYQKPAQKPNCKVTCGKFTYIRP